MKKNRYILLSIVLVLLVALFSVPTIFADTGNYDASISINAVKTPTSEIDLSHIQGMKSISVFKGEQITLKTDILVSKYIVIEDTNTIKAKYMADDSIAIDTTYSGDKYDTSDAYIRRETSTLSFGKVGHYQIVTEYELGSEKFFDGIDINVVEKDIKNISLVPNVKTLRTGTQVDFDLVINDTPGLSMSDKIDVTINGVSLTNLKGYKITADAKKLDIVITALGRTYNESIPVVEAVPLKDISINKQNYGFMLSNKEGKIALNVTKGSYPNISIITDSATLVGTEKVESDQEGYDKYILTIKLDKATNNENMLVRADNKHIVSKLNIIDKVYSISIKPETTKLESGKEAVFHVVINGIMDVDTAIKWTINGTAQTDTSNVLKYKTISNNDIKVTAEVDNFVAEYNYKIDTTTNSIILTVVISLVVIVICIPILLALKKNPKPNLKAMISKDNHNIINALDKLKEDIDEGNTKSMLKRLLKINTMINRSEKRAQQEAFDCENKAFNGALSALNEAKALSSDLLSTSKSNPKDVNINLIDNIIFCLSKANDVIKDVENNM